MMEIQIDAVDPVCGMRVSPSKALRSSFDGKTYFFCSPGCQKKFIDDPIAVLDRRNAGQTPPGEHACCHGTQKSNRSSPAITALDPEAIFTCPMHPEVEHIGPADCPLCGMDLEPKFTTSAGDEHELAAIAQMGWRTIVAGVIAIPLLVLTMGEMVGLSAGRWSSPQISGWLQAALSGAILFGCGGPILMRGIASFRSGHLNMFSLITVGTLAAYFYSFVVLLFPQWMGHLIAHEGSHLPVYFESAGVILCLVLLGQFLELRARRKTGSAIRELLDLTPPRATVLRAGVEVVVPLSEVSQGELVRIKPGDKVPVDGEVVEGNAAIDRSMLTGESLPHDASAGDSVFAGTINQSGTLLIRATAVGMKTVVHGIVELITSAQRSRAPIQKSADIAAAYFVPTVIIVAFLTFFGWGLLGPQPSWVYGLMSAVAVLIIACPCALGLATPISVTVGLGRGAKEGILIKDAEAIERFSKVQTIIFDKTGTLTAGKPEIVLFSPLSTAIELETLIALAASVEQRSEHPYATAIVNYASRMKVACEPVEDFESCRGAGVVGRVAGRVVYIGSDSFLTQRGIPPATDVSSSAQETSAEHLGQGHTVLWLAIDHRREAMLVLADPVKPSAREALAALNRIGLEVVMLTGDHAVTASSVAQQLGIRHYRAGLSPQEKHQAIRRYQEDGRIVAMVGDGINDAPALALADVGIAMGSGTGIAIESADMILMSSDLHGLVRAHSLSQKTMSNIRQNLFFAFFYNSLGIPLAAGVFYPRVGWLLSPMFAAAAMSLSSLSVITNALRLRRARLDEEP